MRLKEIFPDLDFNGIKTNSKEVEKNDLFVCIKGANVDRHDYIHEAINNGAIALITGKDVEVDVPYYKVEDPNAIIEDLYKDFYNNPQDKLIIIGVTGTDGKTTTTSIIQTLIGNDTCGYIGTNGYSCAKFNKETRNTTPGIEKLYMYLDEFVKAGCKYVAMETSSEAFYYQRLKGIDFEVGAITNVDKEHLNTHKTLENYIDCKKQLFRQTKSYSILNSNDDHFEEFKNVCALFSTYGYKKEDTLYIKEYEILPNKTNITFVYENNEYKIESPLLGKFNVENLACALLTCISLGFEMNYLISNIKDIYVDGRMQSIDLGQDFYCMVDYAHTPNGLRRLFEFINTLDVNKVISVMGQAGGRDHSKRKEVGKILLDNSDYAILSTEDPRYENVNDIIDMMLEDVKDYDNYERELDRHIAIKKAIDMAEKNDIVLILGRGNEKYQKVLDGLVAFDDIEEVKNAIKDRMNME